MILTRQDGLPRWNITLPSGVLSTKFAQAEYPEEPPENEQAVLIHAEFIDLASPEKAHFSRISAM
jgi:hypothetical protein